MIRQTETELDKEINPSKDGKWLLTSEEVALHLNVSLRTLQRMRGSGEGPEFIKVSFNRVRYDPRDVYKWVQDRRAKSAKLLSDVSDFDLDTVQTIRLP